MTNIELCLKRFTAICRLVPALFASPESLLAPGKPQVARWQMGKSQTEVFAYGSV